MSSVDKNAVLVGVLKNRRDLNILLTEKWYRVPVKSAPKRSFKYVAFYQPAVFSKEGKRISYYARVSAYKKEKRMVMLPLERAHINANDDYFKISFSKIHKLSRPIRNKKPRRVIFGFTSVNRLRKAKNILELYDVNQTEEIIKSKLVKIGIKPLCQYFVRVNNKKRHYLDLAILCPKGKIAIECDNVKCHSSSAQRLKDNEKDHNLRNLGWTVVRLGEPEIMDNADRCVTKIKKLVKKMS